MPGPYPREFREDVVAVARRRGLRGRDGCTEQRGGDEGAAEEAGEGHRASDPCEGV